MKSGAQFAVCISNMGCVASLELRKIYRLIPDKAGVKHGLVRVIDEMDEDYLFPEECLVSLTLPQAAERVVLRASPYGDPSSCSFCGSIMTRNGSCYRCGSCGSTSGCS